MFLPMVMVSVILLVLYFVVDNVLYRKESPEARNPAKDDTGEALGFSGNINFLLLAGVVASVLMSGIWKPGIYIDVYHVHWDLQNIVRDILLVFIAYLSWKLTDRANRDANGFTWFPIMEVAKLFAGIFLTIVPAIAILKAGTDGAMGALVSLVTDEAGQPVDTMYFLSLIHI